LSARKKTQRGFAIVAAIFLLVVLALLGAVIVSLSSTQQMGVTRDLQGSRAYFAARVGTEWGVYQALQASSCAASSTLPALAGSAAGFTVQVQCARFPAVGSFDEGGAAVVVYQITSTATQGTFGALNYVERQLQSVVSQ
jgi:MSHA biogenesis protein MshP